MYQPQTLTYLIFSSGIPSGRGSRGRPMRVPTRVWSPCVTVAFEHDTTFEHNTVLSDNRGTAGAVASSSA